MLNELVSGSLETVYLIRNNSAQHRLAKIGVDPSSAKAAVRLTIK